MSPWFDDPEGSLIVFPSQNEYTFTVIGDCDRMIVISSVNTLFSLTGRLLPGIAIFFVVVTACVTTKNSPDAGGGEVVTRDPPKWLADRESVYPDSKFMSAEGEGDSASEARKNATAALVSQFETTIEVDTEFSSSYGETLNSGSTSSASSSSMIQKIKESAQQTLSNIKHGDVFLDDRGLYHAVAFINRNETALHYRNLIEEKTTKINDLITQGDEEKDLIAFASYDAAIDLAAQNALLLMQLSLISSVGYKVAKPSYDILAMTRRRSEIGSGVPFSVSITGTFSDELTKVITAEIQDMGFPTAGSAAFSIIGDSSVTPVDLDNGYYNARWRLNCQIINDSSESIVSYVRDKRVSSLSESVSDDKVLKSMEKSIREELIGELNTYMRGQVVGANP